MLRGFVHRDIKPSNVMLQLTTGSATEEIQRVVLMDFGIAKLIHSGTSLTQSGITMGTLAYMAPEQISSARDVNHRADIYALGVMLYQLITGSLPFAADNPGVLIFAHLQRPAPDPRTLVPNLSSSIAAAILRTLSKDPNERYQTAAELTAAFTN